MTINKVTVSPEQKLEYCKLIINDGYTTRQIIELCGASSSSINRWKKQYIQELEGTTPQDRKALTPEQTEIQSLQKQLREAKKDIEILKKRRPYSFETTTHYAN